MSGQQPLLQEPAPRLRGRAFDDGATVSGLAKVEASTAEKRWLRLGLGQPGGKLPLFDQTGQAVDAGLIRSCVAKGTAEPWFINPLKPDWLVCRLTEAGRALLSR